MFHRVPCGRALGSDVLGCHTLAADHSSECRCVQLRSCRLDGEAPHPEVVLCAYSTDVRQLYARQHNIAHHTRGVHNSEILDICACTAEALQYLDGRWIQKSCDHTCRQWTPSESRVNILLDGTAVRTGGRSLVSCGMALHSSVSGLRKSSGLHPSSPSTKSYHMGSG
jgi:hypothetical protein